MNQPIQPLVTLHGDRPITTTLAIAEAFGKQHKNVLQTIQNLDCSEEFNRLNFKLVEYRDSKGEKRPMYEVTRDGFIFVGMGFTGAIASAMKEAYIRAFNAMEVRLVANLPRPGQVEALRMARLIEAVSGELLRANPERKKLLRYRKMGLSVLEIARLMKKAHTTVRREIALLEACGLIETTPLLEARRAQALANPAMRRGGAA